MSTNTTPPEPGNVHLDAWITRQLNDLANQVSEHLDLDAGLRDAQLVDCARLLDESLDEVLDVESGLLAILGRDVDPQPETVIPDSNDSTASAAPSLAQYARNFASLPVNERLRLRSHPSFRTLSLIHSLVVLPAHHQNVIDILDFALDHSRSLDLALDDARNRVLALVRALDRAHVLARALDHDVALAVDLVRYRARVLARALDHDHDLARARHRALALALVLALARDRVLDHTRDLNHASAHDLIRALRKDVIRFSTHDEFAVLASAIENVEAAAADFTTADLTHQDLLEVDLRGVRWSSLTTYWPPGWEEPMLEISVQIDPNGHPDLYEVRDEPHVRHDAHKP